MVEAPGAQQLPLTAFCRPQGIRIDGRASQATGREVSFVVSFKSVQGPTGFMLPGPIEQSGLVKVGDEIVAVNGVECASESTDKIFSLIKEAQAAVESGSARHLSMSFRRP